MIKRLLFVLLCASAIGLVDSSILPFLSPTDNAKLEVPASTTYLHYSAIHPGQLRYSSHNVEEKKQRAIQEGRAIWNEESHCWEYQYYDGKSIFSRDDNLPVVKTSFGYVLVDGHHDLLSSLALGAEWIPVQIVKDFSDLSTEDFWDEAEREGLVYLYDIKGNREIPGKSFSSLVDDPNRYFAAITARKYQEGHTKSKGAEYPLWIKMGKDIPFIEFKISDKMLKNNLRYDYSMGDNPPEEFVEQVREALKKDPIPGLKLVPKRISYTEIDLKSY